MIKKALVIFVTTPTVTAFPSVLNGKVSAVGKMLQ